MDRFHEHHAQAMGIGVAIGAGFVALIGLSMLAGAAIQKRAMYNRYPCWMFDDDEFEGLFGEEWPEEPQPVE